MLKSKKSGLALVTLLVVVALPYPDGQNVSFPLPVIVAEVNVFKMKPKNEPQSPYSQPLVYCGVVAC